MSQYLFKRLSRAQRNKKLKQKYVIFLLYYHKKENYINMNIERRYLRKLSRFIYGQESNRYVRKLINYHYLMIKKY